MLKTASALLLTLALPSLAHSQTNLLLEETNIRTGMGGQFESAQKEYCAAVVKGGAPACLIFSTATFGQSDLYFTALPFASFIHYDQGKYTDKGLTPEEAKALNARRIPPIAANHESAIAFHPDLSILPTVSNTEYPVNYFRDYRLRPGAAPHFFAFVHDVLLPAAKKAGALEFEVFSTTVGESPDRVLIVTRLKRYEELDHGDAIEAALSEKERARWNEVLAHDVDRRTSFIMRYRADLSTDPRPQRH